MFQSTIVKKYITTQSKDELISKWDLFKSFFHDIGNQNRIRELKEEQFQEGFLDKLFVEVFGYIKKPLENYNLVTELKNPNDSRKVDGGIIFNESVKCVIELKGTNTTDLGRVEVQAFSYKNNQPNCKYIVTSNFEKLRFYIEDATEFLEFNLFELTQDEFELMYLCLSSKSVESDIPLKLKSESVSQEDLITKKLYKDYSIFKRELFNNLTELNQGYDKLLLFKKSQKLLDRFLFLFFGEDKFLLPPNSVRLILDDWKDLLDKDVEISLYDRFKKYFGYLNTGFKGKRYDVFPYNGGLFKPDDVLDNILIDDELLYNHTKKLSEYDFESEVDVNILGHIFENSLNEIEEISNELISGEVVKSTSKRKKDGVFYTPKYITKYIVDNTIGKLCDEKKNELQINDEDYITDKKRIKKTIKGLSDKLNEYRNWLLELTICDPSCGSGAFLNQSLDFLIKEHRYVDELQSKLFGDSLVLSDIENSILENNLFGVDINEESVEITKLSLWLRTAQPNRKLNSLSSNIKCGNSLIDEPIEGVENYFKWEQEFPKVFEKGGFDVVIGNPPYVISKKVEYYENYYSTFKCKDLYAYFYEKGLKILKPKGLMGLITPSSFLTNIGFISLRELLIKYHIEYIIDLESNVFSDASVDSSIVIIHNIFSENQSIKCSGPNFVFKQINKELFRRLDSIIFNIYINPNSLLLSDKISNENKIFDDYINFSRGIEFGFKSEKVIKTKESEDFKPLLCGGNISKYQINFQNSYVKHDINNSSIYKSSSIYENEKILVKRIGNTIIGCYDGNKYYNVCDVYNLQLKGKDNYSIKVINGILNSRLINFYFDTKFKSLKKLFPKIPIQNLKLLPIPNFSNINQNNLHNAVDLILKQNIQFVDCIKKFQRTLQRNFEIETLPKKLQEWYLLTYNEFLKELSKNKVKLSLEDEGKWEDFFIQQSEQANNIKDSIDIIDKEIDSMVYQLYNLDDDEIEIIESTI